MRFRMDQEIICVVDGGWFTTLMMLFINFRVKTKVHPKKNQVYTVAGYIDNKNVIIEGFPKDAWDEDAFEPIMSEKELIENLEEVEFTL